MIFSKLYPEKYFAIPNIQQTAAKTAKATGMPHCPIAWHTFILTRLSPPSWASQQVFRASTWVFSFLKERKNALHYMSESATFQTWILTPLDPDHKTSCNHLPGVVIYPGQILKVIYFVKLIFKFSTFPFLLCALPSLVATTVPLVY